MTIFKEVSGQGEDVVILHGWGCDHRHMQPIVDQLKDRYRVTNFDLPGRGKSDWNENIQNIHGIADQLLPHLPKQAIYIGWSFGGLITTSIAARYPEKVVRFVGVTTVPKFIADDQWPGFPLPGFKAAIPEVKRKGVKDFFSSVFDHEFSTINPKPENYHKLMALLDNAVNLDILFKGIDICDATDLRTEFKSLKCPIDLIFSEKDESLPIVLAEEVKHLNSNVTIHTIPEANHMVFWTHPKEFNKTLNGIL